jgi:hypothetical protein
MDNELRDIANKLEGYRERGWLITSAKRNDDGSWDLHIERYAKPIKPEEDADDDN